MTIYYVHAFHAFGQSSDAKPTDVNEGMTFWELDSQKTYVFSAGEWKETKSGSGVWSASSPETLINKTIPINQNTLTTTSGNLGIFGFGNTGGFSFIPIGSANQYLKVNSGASGFEWGDPSVSGSWDPNATETLTNKTLVVQSNTIKQTTPAAGALLLDNGTKYLPLAKGSIGQALKVKVDGTVGWDTDVTGASDYNSMPSRIGYKQGWYDGGASNPDVGVHAHGLLDQLLYFEMYNIYYTPDTTSSTTYGRYVRLPIYSSSEYYQFKTYLLFMRNYSSSMLVKFRRETSVDAHIFMGFTSVMPTEFSSYTVFNNADAFVFGKRPTYTNWRIYSNAGTATASVTDTGIASDTNYHTIELRADPDNNRFQWRLHGTTYDPNAAWNNVTSNIPRSNQYMGMFVSINGYTSGDNALQIYLIEAQNKVMF